MQTPGPQGLGVLIGELPPRASMHADGLILGQIQNDELIVAHLHDRGDRFVRVFGRLRLRVVHFEDGSCDAVGAERRPLIHIYEHHIDVDQDTHSLARNTSQRLNKLPRSLGKHKLPRAG